MRKCRVCSCFEMVCRGVNTSEGDSTFCPQGVRGGGDFFFLQPNKTNVMNKTDYDAFHELIIG